MLSRNTPLTHQVILAILDEIEAGKLIRADGSLPSETDLSERFGVSRATIRDALTRLEYAGIVIRRHGIGTYVNRLITNHPGAVQYWMDETASFGNLIRTSGHRPECRVISSSIIATGSYAAALNRNPQSQVLVAEKIFLSDGTPVIHCTDVVPSERIDPANLELAVSGDSCLESIYLFLETQCHSKVSFQESQVFATVADEKMAVLLDYPIGGALFRLEEVGYSAEMTPLFYGRVHFRGDAVSFLQVRRPAISIGSQSYDRYETESLLAEPVTDDPGR